MAQRSLSFTGENSAAEEVNGSQVRVTDGFSADTVNHRCTVPASIVLAGD